MCRLPLQRASATRLTLTSITLAALLLLQLATPGARHSALAQEGSGVDEVSGPNININSAGVAVTQNFDSLSSTGTANPWVDDTTLTGWYASVATYGAGTGSSTTPTASASGLYSFGTTASERALGSQNTNTTGNIYYAVKLTNNTGATITSLDIAYTGEEWRQNGNTSAQNLDFQYQVANAGVITDANTPSTNWTDFNTLDFVSPVVASAANPTSTAALDGNAAVNRSAKSATMGVTVNPGQEIWLRWVDGNVTGNDHSLAIDDFSVKAHTTFSTDGQVTTDIATLDNSANSVALQSDGKIVVGGYAVNGAGNQDFAVARYNADGTLDSTFGTGGIVTTDFAGRHDTVSAVVVQTDGKIVAVGKAGVSGTETIDYDVAAARYTSAGALDSGFNGTGTVTTGLGGTESATAAVLDGTNIVVAGNQRLGTGDSDFLVLRYTTAGALDGAFNAGLGYVITDLNADSEDSARGVKVQTDGKIVVAGATTNAGAGNAGLNFGLLRLLGTGNADTGFGTGGNGVVTTDFSGNEDQAYAVALQTDGKIVVAGTAYFASTKKDFALARYNSADGSLDTAFSGDGLQTTDFYPGSDIAFGLAVQTDGKLVAVGMSRSSSTNDDFALARYTTAGALDTTFSGDGKQITVFSNGDDRAYGVAIQTDGKVVAAGSSVANPGSSPVNRDFALARYSTVGDLDAEAGSAPVTLPDLALTMTDAVDSVVIGDNITYTVTLANNGPGAATSATFTDTLPSGLDFVSATPSAGTANYNAGTNTVTWNAGTLQRGQTATLTLVVHTTVGQRVANTASASSGETDIYTGNNTVTERTFVMIVVNITFSPNTVVGGCTNPTGTVTIFGPAPAGGVTDNLAVISGGAAASAPASVLIPAGASTATFTLTTNSVASTTRPNIRGTLGTSTFDRWMTVNPGSCN